MQGGTSKPAAGGKAAAGGGGGGISTAGGVGVGLEEEIKKLQRAAKFGKLSDKDEAKLAGLQKKLEAQKEKQRLALDKVGRWWAGGGGSGGGRSEAEGA